MGKPSKISVNTETNSTSYKEKNPEIYRSMRIYFK